MADLVFDVTRQQLQRAPIHLLGGESRHGRHDTALRGRPMGRSGPPRPPTGPVGDLRLRQSRPCRLLLGLRDLRGALSGATVSTWTGPPGLLSNAFLVVATQTKPCLARQEKHPLPRTRRCHPPDYCAIWAHRATGRRWPQGHRMALRPPGPALAALLIHRSPGLTTDGLLPCQRNPLASHR